MSKLGDKINLAIDDANFNVLEIKGFQTNPRLALVAGVAIGYRLGIEHVESLLTPNLGDGAKEPLDCKGIEVGENTVVGKAATCA